MTFGLKPVPMRLNLGSLAGQFCTKPCLFGHILISVYEPMNTLLYVLMFAMKMTIIKAQNWPGILSIYKGEYQLKVKSSK